MSAERPIPEHLVVSPEAAWPKERLTTQQQKVIKAVFTLNEEGSDSFFPDIESQARFAIGEPIQNRLKAKYHDNPDMLTKAIINKYKGKLRELSWGLNQSKVHKNRTAYENYIRDYIEIEQDFTAIPLTITDIRDLVYYQEEYIGITFKDILKRKEPRS